MKKKKRKVIHCPLVEKASKLMKDHIRKELKDLEDRSFDRCFSVKDVYFWDEK